MKRRFKVICKIGGDYTTEYIDCREMTIEGNSYCFWTGEYGETNRLVFAFPVSRTIVEGLQDN